MIQFERVSRFLTVLLPLFLFACGGTSDGQPNVTVSFTASTSTVATGSPLTLTWSSTNATSCTASGGWSGAKDASGSEIVTPSAEGSETYTVSCRGEGEAYSRSVTVEVLPLLAITGSVGAISTEEDTPVTVAVDVFSTNRTALESLTYSLSTQAQNGIVSLEGDALTYTPAENYFGNDSFSVVASAEGVSVSADYSVTVSSVNDAPVITVTANGLPTDLGLDLLMADPSFALTIAVSDIDSPIEALSFSGTLNGESVTVVLDGEAVTVNPPSDYISGPSQATIMVSDGIDDVETTVDFWGAQILSISPDRARVIQLFGNVGLEERQIDHYVVLDDLTDQAIKTAVWEALTFYYGDFFVQGDERRRALVNALFNLLVIDFPEGADVPFRVSTGCNPSAPNLYCMSDIIPQALSFLEALTLYDELADVRVAADIFSLVTGFPGDDAATGRYIVQGMTSAVDAEGEIGPNQLIWTMKREMGRAFGWLGDHSTEAFRAQNTDGKAASEFASQSRTIDFLHADITLADAVSEVKWQHQYRQTSDIPGWNTVDDTSNSALGYWQGCFFHDTHCFRSSYNSIMNGEFTSEADTLAWLEARTPSDAVNYDAVGNEAQFLRALQLQGLQDVTLFLPSPAAEAAILDYNVKLPPALFELEWFVDGVAVDDLASAGIDYQQGGPSDDFVGRLKIPRKPSGSSTRVGYRIRDQSAEPVIKVVDELDTFADVYLGRFSPEGGFYICPESNTAWTEVGVTYCHSTLKAYRSNGSLVTEARSISELESKYPDIKYFIERSGLGVQVMIDWTYF